jgi:hypothetical protein
VALAAADNVTNTTNGTGIPERWELCKSEADIEALQQKYNLTRVTAVPTNAALHPGWPQTVLSIGVWFYAFISLMSGPGSFLGFIFGGVLQIVQMIAWTISFAHIEMNKGSGGWISVTCSTTVMITLFSTLADDDGQEQRAGRKPWTLPWWVFTMFFAMFFWAFASIAEFVVTVQRWSGNVGTIAYMITDNKSCVPYGELSYLEAGVRSHAFRSIQLVEALFCVFVIQILFFRILGSMDGDSSSTISTVSGLLFFFLYIPILTYEIIIARAGSPVAISGNCMLVELDPKYGFLDSQISTYWKTLTSLTGL